MSYNYWCLRFDDTHCIVPILLSQKTRLLPRWRKHSPLTGLLGFTLFYFIFQSDWGKGEEKEKQREEKKLPTVSGILGAFM